VLFLKIHQLQSAFSKNPPNAKCFFEKSNCEMLFRKIHQVRSAQHKNPPTVLSFAKGVFPPIFMIFRFLLFFKAYF